MRSEKRRNARKTFERSGFIARSGASHREPCSVLDVSSTGARLACTTPKNVPDRFVLQFSAGGGVARECVVVWRRGFEIGVRYVRQASPQPSSATPAALK
jgi:hypothetical protein